MSAETKSNPQRKLKIPHIKGDALEFAETILSIGMPYEYAVQAFLDSFPEYAEHETLTEEEVHEIIGKRFRGMRRQTKRASYHRIKEFEASLKKLLDCIPVASPILRLIELEKLRQDGGLKCEQMIKVLAAAAKEQDRLMPRERTAPFSGLPDLIPKTTPTPTSESETNGKSPSDPFGGAMINHANPGQETPEDG